jgi:hypothetical protein
MEKAIDRCKYVILLLTFLLGYKANAQIILWNFNSVDKSDLVVDEIDSIYDYWFNRFIDNTMFNFTNTQNRVLYPKEKIRCFSLSKITKTTIKFYHREPDSNGLLQGQFYYVTLDSFVIASGYFFNNKLEGTYIENSFDFEFKDGEYFNDSCVMKRYNIYDDSTLFSYSKMIYFKSNKYKGSSVSCYHRGTQMYTLFIENENKELPKTSEIVINKSIVNNLIKENKIKIKHTTIY